MPTRSYYGGTPVFVPDGSSPIWHFSSDEELRLPFPAEFEFSYIDLLGQVLIVAPFQSARSFSSGRAMVCHYPAREENGKHYALVVPNLHKRWKMIDTFANVLGRADYDFIAPFNDAKHTVARRGKDSFLLDRNGAVVATYAGIQAVSAAAGRIVTDGGRGQQPFGLIDYNGDKVCKQNFDSVGLFCDGLAAAQSPNFVNSARERSLIRSRWGFISKDGDLAIEDHYQGASPFSHGYASVKSGELWGLIDTEGKVVIDFKYDHLGQFDAGTGLLPFRRGEHCGFINLSGEEAIAPRFLAVKQFSQGLAPASLDGLRWGYINRSGQFEIDPVFQMAFPFSDERGLVCRDVSGEEERRPVDTGNPTHLVRKARALRENYKYDEARALFDKIVKTAPGTLAAKQAAAFSKTDLPTKAPPDVVALYAAAIIESTAYKFAQAEPKLMECIEKEPDFEPAYGALASLYIRSQRPAEARRILTTAIARNSNYARAYDFLAIAHGLLGDNAAAERALADLFKLNPYYKLEQ